MESETASSDIKKDEPKSAESSTAPVGVAQSSKQQGVNGPFPPELNRWNWGAFLLTWIWGVFNNVYIALILLVVGWIPLVGPIIGLAGAIYLGINGNRLAWQNRKFESVEQFDAVQKAWTKGAVWFIVCSIVIGLLAAFLIVSFSLRNSTQDLCNKSRQQAAQSGKDISTYKCQNDVLNIPATP